MTTTREAGQSIESAEALEAYMQAGQVTSDARSLVGQLERQLRAARKTLKAAQAIESDALLAYEATPYSE